MTTLYEMNSRPVFKPSRYCSIADRTAAVGQTLLSDSLYNDLFANYSSSLIPICTVGGNVSVTMDLALRQVMDLVSPLCVPSSSLSITWV